MPLNDQGFTLIDIPEPERTLHEAFSNLVPDPYCGGNQRRRRFSQYKLLYGSNGWMTELLPPKPFIQPKKYNTLVGGILREFSPLQIDPTSIVALVADAIPLARTREWQVNVHNVRITTNKTTQGIVVPEGKHQDGHEYAALVVFDRFNVQGGITSIYSLDSDEPVFQVKIERNQALVFNDEKVRHYTSEVCSESGSDGHRDNWIIAINDWENRRYGQKHVSRSIDR